jgi:hypothetical protein
MFTSSREPGAGGCDSSARCHYGQRRKEGWIDACAGDDCEGAGAGDDVASALLRRGGDERNTAAEYIANPLGTDAGHYLELIGSKDGSFDVFNSRTNATKHYAAAH